MLLFKHSLNMDTVQTNFYIMMLINNVSKIEPRAEPNGITRDFSLQRRPCSLDTIIIFGLLRNVKALSLRGLS